MTAPDSDPWTAARAEVVQAMQDVADRWSREAAGIITPKYVPGLRVPIDEVQAMADAKRLDQCADELRVELARWT